MKAIFTFLGGVFCFFFVQAQKPAYDVVLKLNGDEMTGKVIEVNDDNIKFSYKGESVAYTIKKSEILKITFSSGRIEMINRPVAAESMGSAPSAGNVAADKKADPGLESHHNKVAVLPFRFVVDRQTGDEELGYIAQAEAFAFLNQHSAGLTLQDVNTTNSLLAKAGISYSNARNFTPADICSALGVEYIVQSTITLNRGSVVNTGSTSGSALVKPNQGKGGSNTKVTGHESTFSSSTQNYESSVLLNIFNDSGNTLYSESRKAMLSGQDSYKNTLHYLLKRSPIYRK